MRYKQLDALFIIVNKYVLQSVRNNFSVKFISRVPPDKMCAVF